MTKQPQKPNFHKLYVTLYNNPDWLQLTALHRWLYVVLLTGSQSNSVGCYVCRLSVLSEDAGFDVTVNDMETVCKQMGIRFDNRSRTVYIPKRLKWDPPANPNVLYGMVKTACNLPQCENRETVMATVTRMVTELVYITDRGHYFIDNWQEKLAEIINGLDNGLPNLSETPYPYPQPYPQPYPLPKPKDFFVPAQPKRKKNESITETAEPQSITSAARAWSILVKCLNNQPMSEGETIDTPEIQAAIKLVGGGLYLSKLEPKYLPSIKKDFIAAYNQASKQ